MTVANIPYVEMNRKSNDTKLCRILYCSGAFQKQVKSFSRGGFEAGMGEWWRGWWSGGGGGGVVVVAGCGGNGGGGPNY